MALDITQQFVNLCQKADDIDRESLDCRDLEPVLIALIELVKAHTDQRSLFVNLFLAVANGDIVAPPALLPFCMRELRFPEIYDHIVQEWDREQGTARWARRMKFMHHLMRAYEDMVWEDAEMWPYYAYELKPPTGQCRAS